MAQQTEQGIEWSAPVLVRRDTDGKMMAEIPEAVIERLDIEEGDVVCYTGFVDNAIEFWSVKKSPYTSLEDEDVSARLAGETK